MEILDTLGKREPSGQSQRAPETVPRILKVESWGFSAQNQEPRPLA